MAAFRLLAFLCCLLALQLPQAAVAETFKIATISPANSSWMRIMREGAEEIAARTEGRVEFKFYPGGVMGDDQAVIRKIRFRQLQGAALTVGALQQFYTDVQIYSMPMMFRDYAEVDAVRAELDPVVIAGLEEAGWVAFGFGEAGFAYAMSKNPGATLEDARAQKVWIPSDDAGSLATVEGFGITPVPLSIADVLTGLQTDLIEAVAVPPVGALALQWYTQLDYLLDLPLLYVYGVLTVEKRAFERISEPDQAIVREVLAQRSAEITALNRRDHEAALEVLATQGIEFQQPPDDAALETWREGGRAAQTRMIETGAVSDALWQRALRVLEAHRAAQ
ncbi:MAG: TRAP transporter substrate-binding protein DctP [Pseudomonadales bacterium]|jgi:TRAP-type C4-dicarboxylate transport system substrate-binding protein|nr:TRAP transporter substrate-binding protein DctP [Pseudomonadales bacterium]